MLLPRISRSMFRCLATLDALQPACCSTSVHLRKLSVEAAHEPPRISKALDPDEEPTEEMDYEQQLKALMPSEKVWSAAHFNQHKKIQEIIKELEIYAYMGSFIPKALTDDDWFRMLNTTETVGERVSFLEYIAVKQRRRERDSLKRNHRKEELAAKLNEERAKFERGEMGYGPDLYQLIHNPMRNRKKINITQGARVVSTLRCDETPKIAFDLQYMFQAKPRIQHELGNQMQYVISENLDSRLPFHIGFVNCPKSEAAQNWLQKCVGFYGGQYTHQTVLPDFTDKGVKEAFPDRDAVYISRHARDMIDGPLNVGTIALCVSMDTAREALGAARRGRIRAVRLPITKYVKWQKGPMYIPFPNIIRIFREVHISCGDWETALRNNISKRHLLSPEEQDTQAEIEKANRRKTRLREKTELIKTIQEATGHL